MMLFNLCVAFTLSPSILHYGAHIQHWMPFKMIRVKHPLQFKWCTECLALASKVARQKIGSPKRRDWLALFINNDRQSYRLVRCEGIIDMECVSYAQYRHTQRTSDNGTTSWLRI